MIKGAYLRGIEAQQVDIEVGFTSGSGFKIIGLGRAAIQESKLRLEHSIRNSGLEWPQAMITVNLAPADFPKEGTSLDLAIALAILEKADSIQPIHSQVFACFCQLNYQPL